MGTFTELESELCHRRPPCSDIDLRAALSYWTMDFDASPRSLSALNSKLGKDNRVVRWTILKQGEKIEDVLSTRSKTRMEGISAASMHTGPSPP